MGTRDKLIHDYLGVDLEITWAVAGIGGGNEVVACRRGPCLRVDRDPCLPDTWRAVLRSEDVRYLEQVMADIPGGHVR